MNKSVVAMLILSLLITTLVGCTGNTPTNETLESSTPTEVVENNTDISDPSETGKPGEVMEPTESETQELETETMYKGTAYERAFKIISLLDKQDQNTMISPLSIEMALSMATNGMDENAKSTLENYLGQEINLLNSLSKEYLDLKDGAEDKVISIANSLWVTEGFKDSINADFKNILEENYSAEVNTFNTSPDTINNWVSNKTNGMIPTIIDDIPNDLSSILLNAVYFDGKWVEPFTDSQLEEGKFNSRDNTELDCTYMNGLVNSYMENSQATAFRKEYNDGYSFIGILPKYADKFDISTFNMQTLLETETAEYDVVIKIPKFESSYTTSLKQTLEHLGLYDIFRANAMSKILDIDAPTGISDIVHKTAIKMNEQGTEASAVTGIMVKTTGIALPKEQKQVYLDRPFMYAILDNSNNQILFLGTVNNISKN